MTEPSLFSESPQESSEDNMEEESLDEYGPVADSGVSEVGSVRSQLSEEPEELSTISVSEEIKKFQRDINTVATENSKFFTWKQKRSEQGSQGRNLSVREDNLALRGTATLTLTRSRS